MQRVASLEDRVRRLEGGGFGATFASDATPAVSGPDGPSEEVRDFILAGDLLRAIKAYRAETGSDLSTAKDACEGYKRNLGV